MTDSDNRPQPNAVRSWREDPPPFPWLDDPTRAQGPTPPGVAIVIGTGLALVGLFAVVLGIFGGDHARVARLVCGAPFVPMGAFIVHMGTARVAWRRRHPGVDPAQVAAELGANVGDPLGNDSIAGRVGRWVLVVLCAFIVFICVISLVELGSGRSPGRVPSIVVVVLFGLFAATLGVMTLRRERRPRA